MALLEAVKTSILSEIERGAYPVGQTLPPVADLAAAHACSVYTVRRALSQLAADGVVKPVRRKGTIVLQRRRLGRVLLHTSLDEHTNLLLQNPIYLALSEAGYDVDVVAGAANLDMLRTKVRQICRREPERRWLVTLSPRQEHPQANEISELLLSAFAQRVRFSFYPPGESADAYAVGPDLAGMARDVIEHLLRLGHRRIAVFDEAGPQRSWPGATAEQARHLIEVAGGQFIPYTSLACTPAEMRHLFSEQRATALWALHDHMAMLAENACLRLGLRVPEDVSIVGRFDTPWSDSGPVTLTSVSLDPQATAAAIVQAVHRFDRAGARADGVTLVKPMLIPRRSTGPAPTPSDDT